MKDDKLPRNSRILRDDMWDAYVVRTTVVVPKREKRKLPVHNGKAIFKIQHIQSPIMKEHRGWRFSVALPNMAGRTFAGEECPSFEKPFYLCHFGDYETKADLLVHAPRIGKMLKRMGLVNLEMVGSEEKPKAGRRPTDQQEEDDVY